ncbi:MAG: DUF366 family protein [Deltaproteobacteria bacterium]|nr:DUF366 family protein [Deltaproteobacteria bacterium]MBI4224300.1 DUF366 family protein [Deltaproteobacteria bacterium]
MPKAKKNTLKIRWLETMIDYDGTLLHSGWIQKASGLEGNAMAAFCGRADVPVENMVDLEDVAANAPIFSEAMLHFIVEIFDGDLEKMVLRQRLLMAIIEEELKKYPACAKIARKGDDLFDGPAKLSVSIATHSPRSGLIHTGLNISSRNTPVLTKGLADYDISPKKLAVEVMAHFAEELAGIRHAAGKVRPVG